MKESISQRDFESNEDEPKITSEVVISIFRHGEKEDGENKPDEQVRLTEQGRKDTVSKSESGAGAKNVDQALAGGSPRVRSQQTALIELLGKEGAITGERSFEELLDKVEGEMWSDENDDSKESSHGVKDNVGSKIRIDERLDFNADPDTKYANWLDSIVGDKRMMSKFMKRSDYEAFRLREASVHTYSAYAQNIADLINRYINASDRWDNLVQDEDKDYDKNLERFFGTHGLVGESFLTKVIEVVEGYDERDRFLQAVGGSGFDFNEGFDMAISHEGGTKKIRITYETETEEGDQYEFNREIKPKVIADIASGKHNPLTRY
jgi:hypothetical protein